MNLKLQNDEDETTKHHTNLNDKTLLQVQSP